MGLLFLFFSVKYSTLRTVWYRQLLRDTVVTFHGSRFQSHQIRRDPDALTSDAEIQGLRFPDPSFTGPDFQRPGHAQI